MTDKSTSTWTMTWQYTYTGNKVWSWILEGQVAYMDVDCSCIYDTRNFERPTQ